MGKRILIVEDDADVALALAEVLEMEGMSASVAANGVEALDKLRQGTAPDLILLDMMMPVMDGSEFRRQQLRLGEDLARIPVVVLTADGNAPRKAATIGAQGHLMKPTSIDDLLAEIARVAGLIVPAAAG